MKKIRFILSVWICKVLILVGKLMGKKGSSTPGVFAFKVCPDVLKILSKKVKHGIIAVCGTNGKTTTNNLIDKILTKRIKEIPFPIPSSVILFPIHTHVIVPAVKINMDKKTKVALSIRRMSLGTLYETKAKL